MIAKTIGSERRRLEFAETVVQEFAFLEATYGFRRIRQSVTFVRHESEQLFLNVFHGRGSYEIGVELGRLSNPHVHYRLSSLVRGLDPDYPGQLAFQASTKDAVARCVAEVGRILRMHCGAVLSGDAKALRLVEQAATAESQRVTLRAQYAAVIDRADQAWETKDLRRATELYQEAAPALDKTRRRRLEYLLGRKTESS